VPGKAERLRNHHGIDAAGALTWARRILNPYSRCAICGVPARIALAYHRLGYRFWGKSPLLQVDHVDPWGGNEESNLRLLCSRCNATRGPALRTDEEVLARVTRQYQRYLTLPELWFLNYAPGKGGIARRGKRHEEILRGPALEDDGPDAPDGPRPDEGRGDSA